MRLSTIALILSAISCSEYNPPGNDPPAATATTTWWKPSSSVPMQLHWQLSTTFSYPRDVVPGAVVYDLDGETTTATVVAKLHAMNPNVRAICYVNVGTFENFRSDASAFPNSVKGATNGWPGERWLDIRQQSILLPIMQNRFINWCKNKGFDAVEPDNLDGWQNNSGFPLTRTQSISYITAIANLAHSLNLSIGLKNLAGEESSLVPTFDWILNEECFRYNECSGLKSFTTAGKAAWNVEYKRNPTCSTASSMKVNAQRRDLDLVGPTQSGYRFVPCLPANQTTW